MLYPFELRERITRIFDAFPKGSRPNDFQDPSHSLRFCESAAYVAGMTIREKQDALVARYSIIEDAQERLAAIVARGRKWPGVGDLEKCDEHRVRGCVSQVWLVGAMDGARCRFQMSADSPLVQGLAALVCELYDGGGADEIVAVESRLIEALGLDRQISPTRLNGLANIHRTIREFAAAHSA